MTRERSSARDSLLPNVTHLIPEYRIVRRRTHDRPPERLLPGATPKRELRTIGLTTPSRSRLHPRASRRIRFCFPASPSGRPVILAICEDVQGVYRSIAASLSAGHSDRQSAGANADERREPFHGSCSNRFCGSEPLHADVQEGHWSYTTRVASESHPLEDSIGNVFRQGHVSDTALRLSATDFPRRREPIPSCYTTSNF